jgi:predicted regulator of Ras-like GTPase activity (Roadblock/LC7/MglB family)
MESNHPNEIITDDISSIWIEYENVGNELEEKLNYLLIENEDGNIMTTNIYGYILTMKAGNNIKLGTLKKHLESLAEYLNNVFKPFKEIIEKREEEEDENNN